MLPNGRGAGWGDEEWSVGRKTKSLVSFSGLFPLVLKVVLIKSC